LKETKELLQMDKKQDKKIEKCEMKMKKKKWKIHIKKNIKSIKKP
jgi:hypothetical protein